MSQPHHMGKAARWNLTLNLEGDALMLKHDKCGWVIMVFHFPGWHFQKRGSVGFARCPANALFKHAHGTMRGRSNDVVTVLVLTASTGSLSVGYWLIRRYLDERKSC